MSFKIRNHYYKYIQKGKKTCINTGYKERVQYYFFSNFNDSQYGNSSVNYKNIYSYIRLKVKFFEVCLRKKFFKSILKCRLVLLCVYILKESIVYRIYKNIDWVCTVYALQLKPLCVNCCNSVYCRTFAVYKMYFLKFNFLAIIIKLCSYNLNKRFYKQ